MSDNPSDIGGQSRLYILYGMSPKKPTVVHFHRSSLDRILSCAEIAIIFDSLDPGAICHGGTYLETEPEILDKLFAFLAAHQDVFFIVKSMLVKCFSFSFHFGVVTGLQLENSGEEGKELLDFMTGNFQAIPIQDRKVIYPTEKISKDKEPLEAANKATAHLYISNPLKNRKGFMDSMFSTHPPISERVKRLEGM